MGRRRIQEEEEILDEEDYEEENEEEEEDELDSNFLIKREKRRIGEAMENYDPASDEYKLLMQRLADLSEYERNVAMTKKEEKESSKLEIERERLEKERFSWVAPTFVQSLFNSGTQVLISIINRKNLQTVVNHENSGEIITSKGLGFIKKS